MPHTMMDEGKNCIAVIHGRSYRCKIRLAFLFEGDRYAAIEQNSRSGDGMMIAKCVKPFEKDEHYITISYPMQLKLADFLHHQ